jgi:hypothetical protein
MVCFVQGDKQKDPCILAPAEHFNVYVEYYQPEWMIMETRTYFEEVTSEPQPIFIAEIESELTGHLETSFKPSTRWPLPFLCCKKY